MCVCVKPILNLYLTYYSMARKKATYIRFKEQYKINYV